MHHPSICCADFTTADCEIRWCLQGEFWRLFVTIDGRKIEPSGALDLDFSEAVWLAKQLDCDVGDRHLREPEPRPLQRGRDLLADVLANRAKAGRAAPPSSPSPTPPLPGFKLQGSWQGLCEYSRPYEEHYCMIVPRGS